MDWGRAFQFQFQDKDWIKKILIGGVLFLVPIFGWLVIVGYAVQTAKNVKNGQETPLPEWDDWGDRFMTGLLAFVTILIYAIPGIVVGLIPCIGVFFNIAWSLFVIPTAYIQFLKHGDIGGALKVNEAVEFIKVNWLNILIVSLMNIVLVICAALGIIALCVGVLFTMFWAQLGYANLIGQLWRSSESSKPAAA